MKRRIRVAVGPGMFSMEKSASFEANGQHYNLIVDASSIQGDTLEVRVISEGEEDAIIDLPRETFTSGNRIRISKSSLLPA